MFQSVKQPELTLALLESLLNQTDKLLPVPANHFLSYPMFPSPSQHSFVLLIWCPCVLLV